MDAIGYDPESKKFIQETNRTSLSPEEEKLFQEWRRSLPQNLQEDNDLYDLRGAWRGGLKPTLVDGEYHLSSRDPKRGLILKSEKHPTFHKTLQGESEAGYEIYKDEKTGRLYSKPKEQ